MVLKVNGYTFRGSNCHFHCCPPYELGSFKSRPHFGKTLSSRLAHKSWKLSPFENMLEEDRVVPMHLKSGLSRSRGIDKTEYLVIITEIFC